MATRRTRISSLQLNRSNRDETTSKNYNPSVITKILKHKRIKPILEADTEKEFEIKILRYKIVRDDDEENPVSIGPKEVNKDALLLYEYWSSKQSCRSPKEARKILNNANDQFQKLGCSPENLHLANKTNWRTVDDALAFVRKYQNYESYSNSIDCQLFEGCLDDEKDMIYLRPFVNYIYVYVSLPRKNLCLVIDGENYYLRSNEQTPIRRLIRRELGGRQIRGLEFKSQTCVDHCVSSAALIVLKCKEIYKNDNPKGENWLNIIEPDPYLKSESLNFMEYNHSVALPEQSNLPECPKCGDKRRKWRNENFKMHIESCDGIKKKRKRD